MINCLAIDTTTNLCSVALRVDGRVIDHDRPMAQGHSEHVLPMIDALLAQADVRLSALDALVVDHGPGSFTGIRVGVGVAQGLAFAADLPVICVSSLAILAQGCGETDCIAMIDARMQQVYFAVCQHDTHQNMTMVNAPALASPMDALATIANVIKETDTSASDWTGVGSGFGAYREISHEQPAKHWKRIDANALPRAKNAIELADREWRLKNVFGAEHVLPLYIRNQVVQKVGKKASK